MDRKDALRLSREDREKAVASIRRYLADELDLEVGDLKAGFVLDFFLEELGPTVYNRAIAEARAYLEERVGDLEGVCHRPEFPGSDRKP